MALLSLTSTTINMSTIAQEASPGESEVDHAPSATQSDKATASDSTAAHNSSEIAKDASDEQAAQLNPFWKPRAPPMLGPDGQPLSRNATKKLLKQQQFLERRPQMRQQEKLKRKQKEKERREAIESGNTSQRSEQIAGQSFMTQQLTSLEANCDIPSNILSFSL